MDKIEAADRIRKVLALTASSNEHEAANAAQRVQQLLAQHRLTLDDVLANELGETRHDVETNWRAALFNIVARACGCVTVTLIRDKALVVSVCGLQIDRETALDMYRRIALVIARRAGESWREHVASLTDPQLGIHPALLEEGAEAEWTESFITGALSNLYTEIVDPKQHAFAARPGAGIRLDALVPVTELREAACGRALSFATKRFGTLRVRQGAGVTILPSAARQGQREKLT